jgi:hypothetical protein
MYSGQNGSRKQADALRESMNHGSGAAMYYDEDSGALTFAAGVMLGVVIGASFALLTAPQSGKKTRKRLIRAVSTARESAVDRWGDLTDDVQDVVRSGRRRIRL